MELAKEKGAEAFTGQEPWDFHGLLQEERLGKEVQMFSGLPHSHVPVPVSPQCSWELC